MSDTLTDAEIAEILEAFDTGAAYVSFYNTEVQDALRELLALRAEKAARPVPCRDQCMLTRLPQEGRGEHGNE